MRALTLITFVVVLGTSACAADTPEVVLWESFGFEWESLSHRVAFLRAGAQPAEDPGSVDAQLGLIGGAWSTGDVAFDLPVYDLGWRTVTSRHVAGLYGQTELTIDASGLATTTVEVDLDAAGLAGAELFAVSLAGVEFDSNVPQSADYPSEDYAASEGWTPQGFGVGVGEPARADDTLSFEAWMHFKPGPLDRVNMNEALPFAQVGGTLSWLVLAVNGAGDPATTSASLEAHAYYEIDPPYTPHPPIDPALRTMTLSGDAGLSNAVPLLRSWDFELNRSLEEEGRYLRAFSAGIETFTYDADAGAATVLVDAYCSIESVIEEGDLEVDFAAEVGLLQWSDPKAVVDPGALSGLAETLGVFDQVVSE